MYAWACERTQYSEESREKLEEALFGQAERQRLAQGDNVSPEVVAEEMDLFRSFSAEHSALSRGVT